MGLNFKCENPPDGLVNAIQLHISRILHDKMVGCYARGTEFSSRIWLNFNKFNNFILGHFHT